MWNQRTYDISLDKAGFIYQYEVCAKKFLGVCSKHEMKREFVDWNDPLIRAKFHAARFVLSRDRE